MKILHLYKKYSSEPKIYFPYQVDYRGRVYAVPTFVNPQSCDLGRSGLEFANGVPINNDEDSKWLRIHGANVFGIKGTFEDRLNWINQRTKEIQMSDGVRFYSKLRSAGHVTQLDLHDAMQHCFHGHWGTPEAKVAVERVAEWFEEYLVR